MKEFLVSLLVPGVLTAVFSLFKLLGYFSVSWVFVFSPIIFYIYITLTLFLSYRGAKIALQETVEEVIERIREENFNLLDENTKITLDVLSEALDAKSKST